MIRTMTFTETVAGITYTATTSVSPGYRLLDVLVETDTAWTAATAALTIGDSDATDSLVKALSVKAQGGTAAKSKSGTNWGNGLNGTNGPYSAAGPGKLYPSGSIITAIVTAGTPGGPTGISRVQLLMEQIPTSIRRATVV